MCFWCLDGTNSNRVDCWIRCCSLRRFRHKTPGTKGRFLVCRLTGLRPREVMDFFSPSRIDGSILKKGRGGTFNFPVTFFGFQVFHFVGGVSCGDDFLDSIVQTTALFLLSLLR